ncbi:DUF2889 domain-containing protein [Novosphingobium sp. JCM 18896]|uniref:DUF2889 domain-containing protein n=1 Tax=Novosphingobium sp. JCM 18896 TaxID=2989731 RepID=UPI0022214C37|nr:DUF2889 domain-containing protein [Novosphingobium sp. JCM 18896]MCW1432300.1 DUF2889 domain-containing protein [Novosphingobium sp. JCM 18896]
MALTRYPLNDDYGAGAFRRRVRQRTDTNRSTAIVDDSHHSMWVRLHHDGAAVTGVESAMLRFPADTCPGARSVLDELVGYAISTPAGDLFAGGRARRNCTHLFDLAVLAFRFIRDVSSERVMDFFLPDAPDGQQRAQAYLDGERVLDWWLEDEVIVSPPSFAGFDLNAGFISRVMATHVGIERDMALMMQKSVHVARGRKRVVDRRPGHPLTDAIDMLDACYTYSEPRFSKAGECAGYVRDFSDGVTETPWPL